jgi:DNA-binding response OmpR family regulator
MLLALVEDDPLVATALSQELMAEGFAVEVLGTGALALQRFERLDLDAAIVDMGLPDMDGAALIAAARGKGMWAPILVATARTAIDERVRALEAGADDYVVKPFASAEIVARLRALTRRAAAPRWAPLRCEDVVLAADARSVTVAGQPVKLSPREFALLEYLLRRRGDVVSRLEILTQVFGYDFDPGTNLIAVHVAHLRKKLEGSRVAIETVRAVGFSLKARPE